VRVERKYPSSRDSGGAPAGPDPADPGSCVATWPPRLSLRMQRRETRD